MSEGETQRTEEEPKLDELKVPGLNVYISFCCHIMFEFYVKPQIPDINSHFPKLAQKLQLHSCYLLLQKSSWIQRNYNADKYSYFPTYLGLASSKEILFSCQICSVQFSRSVVPDSSRAHELQHTRPPCPSPTLGVHPDSCPLSRWCHLTISSSVVPFSSCPQSFPASGSFQMSQLFASGDQSIGFQFQHQSFQWTTRTNLL